MTEKIREIIVQGPVYVLVHWPWSQTLMEQSWFDECFLMNDEKHLDDHGSATYFVPLERFLSLIMMMETDQNSVN